MWNFKAYKNVQNGHFIYLYFNNYYHMYLFDIDLTLFVHFVYLV